MRIPQILTENLVRQSTRMGVKYCFFIINNITIDHQWNNELKLCGPYSQCGCGEIFSSLESPFYLLAVLFVHWSKISIKRNLVGVLPVDIKKKKISELPTGKIILSSFYSVLIVIVIIIVINGETKNSSLLK